MKWKKYPVDLIIILSIYSIGFLIGTSTHAIGIWQYGFLAQHAPLLISIYWDSLTFLDPLAALLVWTKPKLGVRLAVGIMLSDIIINTYSYASGIFGEPIAGMIPMFLLLQALFATYVFVTAPVVLEKLRSTRLR